MNEELVENMKEVRDIAERSIKDLARVRAVMLKTGAREEDVTEFITRTGKYYGNKYNKMTLEQLMLDMLGEMIQMLANKEE